MLIKLCILLGGLFSFSILPKDIWVQRWLPLCRYVCCGRQCTRYNSLSLEVFLFIYDQQLAKAYKMTCKNWKGATLLPPSDVYVRSFLCLFYTLIKLGYTKVPSGQALSLAPHQNPFLWRPRIPASFTAQSHLSSWGLVRDLQDKM